MARTITALVAGLIFGLGLALAGMTDPAKVIGFLDLAGAWNPALAFVMGAGVIVTFIGYRLVLARPKPVLEAKFQIPTRTDIDAPLVVGAALFGIGWGLAGYCPGPALSSLIAGNGEVFALVGAMIAGMITVRVIRARG
ncbi:MAG: YeeE/YedE family protein [Zavarzinia sp.]|nr:YeeE/YedE family protein [Zavarzinia sp.]